jgi:hypothetical protein
MLSLSTSAKIQSDLHYKLRDKNENCWTTYTSKCDHGLVHSTGISLTPAVRHRTSPFVSFLAHSLLPVFLCSNPVDFEGRFGRGAPAAVLSPVSRWTKNGLTLFCGDTDFFQPLAAPTNSLNSHSDDGGAGIMTSSSPKSLYLVLLDVQLVIKPK